MRVHPAPVGAWRVQAVQSHSALVDVQKQGQRCRTSASSLEDMQLQLHRLPLSAVPTCTSADT
jgi:hypothetical protein